MQETVKSIQFCALCGEPIESNPSHSEDEYSSEHVPPKQFYPKELRKKHRLNLWHVPTHKKCNNEFRKDEEYFYHVSYPLVQRNNPHMAQVIIDDLKRRKNKPQTPAMIRSILKTFKTKTDSGLYLPPGIVQFDQEKSRMNRVAIKIAQCLYFRDNKEYLPFNNCKYLRYCESESDVEELYECLPQVTQQETVMPDVFSYWSFEIDETQLFRMLFWNAFMFYLAFDRPSATI